MVTKKQKAILNVISEFIKENSFPPTMQEIGQLVGLKSKSTVYRHLVNLREKGYIDWWEGCPRTFRILKGVNQ